MKKLFTLLTLFALLVIDVHSQTFQGVTEGDIAVTYTLDLINGMRVASPQKGIYIRNGRKVVVR